MFTFFYGRYYILLNYFDSVRIVFILYEDWFISVWCQILKYASYCSMWLLSMNVHHSQCCFLILTEVELQGLLAMPSLQNHWLAPIPIAGPLCWALQNFILLHNKSNLNLNTIVGPHEIPAPPTHTALLSDVPCSENPPASATWDSNSCILNSARLVLCWAPPSWSVAENTIRQKIRAVVEQLLDSSHVSFLLSIRSCTACLSVSETVDNKMTN